MHPSYKEQALEKIAEAEATIAAAEFPGYRPDIVEFKRRQMDQDAARKISRVLQSQFTQSNIDKVQKKRFDHTHDLRQLRNELNRLETKAY